MFTAQWVGCSSEFLFSSMFVGKFSYVANNFHATAGSSQLVRQFSLVHRTLVKKLINQTCSQTQCLQVYTQLKTHWSSFAGPNKVFGPCLCYITCSHYVIYVRLHIRFVRVDKALRTQY